VSTARSLKNELCNYSKLDYKKIMKFSFNKFILFALVFATSRHASAASFKFSYTFDGTSASLDSDSDFPTASLLQPGDDMLLTVLASDNDYWEVISPLTSPVYAGYFTLPSAVRTFNSIETLFLDGSVVNTRTRTGGIQQFVHFERDDLFFSPPPPSLFAIGQQFDKYVLNYTLIDDENTSTQAETDQLGFIPFYNSTTEITYVKSPSVPVPGPLPLLGLGAAFAYSRKLRRTINGHRTSAVHSFPARQV
jgi:hypothetical protein